MKYKTVIFDLDGTVLDTLDDLFTSVNYALKKNGLPLRSQDEVRSFVGNGIRKLIERAVPENCSEITFNSVFNDFKNHYAVHNCDNTKPYVGIFELLTELKEAGIKTGLVSNKADFAVQVLVVRFFNGYFDFAVGEREGIKKKPAPDSVFEALSQLDADKNTSVYIGDSEVDILTARNAEIECVCVDWGFRDREFLNENGAKAVVSSVGELKNFIL